MSLIKKYLWRVYSPSLGAYATTVSETEPTVFPIDGSPIDPNATVIIKNEFENIESSGSVRLNSNDSNGILLEAPSIRQRSDMYIQTQPAHVVVPNTNYVLNSLQLLNGILVSSPNARVTWTLPNALELKTQIDNVQENDSFDFSVINNGSKSIQLSKAGSDTSMIFMGDTTIEKFTSASFRIRLFNVESNVGCIVYRLC